MQRSFVLLCLSLVVFAAFADEPYRDFTNTQGQSIRGRVLSFDARKQVVRIERDNGVKADIPISALLEQDQSYIRAWNDAQGFADEDLFRISCKEKKVDETEEEIRQDLTWSSGDTDKDFLMNVITRERIAYKFEFRNLNAAPLSGIRMEYKIYYEQSEMTHDRSKPKAEQKHLHETVTLDAVPAEENIIVQTKPVEIHEDAINEIDSSSGDPRQAGKGEVLGIRARLYMTLATGEEIVREVCEPLSLSSKTCPW
jgi:hypothetical protein